MVAIRSAWATTLTTPTGTLRRAPAAGTGGGRYRGFFLFPAHDLAGGYNMPQAEVRAFERVIRPRIGV
jgi:hypothetical protein